MKRFLLASLALISAVWMAGCGGGSGGTIGGGTTFSPAALNGQYAFLLSGVDSTGNSMGMAGSFKADGAGHITGGEVDVNDNGSVSTNAALTGTYSFDGGGNGTLGTILLTNTVGSVTHPLQFGFTLNSTGTFGDIMDFSANNFLIAGTMQQQSSAVFTLAAVAGTAPYIITINGRNGSSPTSELGTFTLGSSGGAATNTSFDRSISSVGTAGPDTGNNAVVTFPPANAPDANGRGLFTVFLSDAVTGSTTTTTQDFAYYAISTSRFIAVQTDTTGSMTADASRQSAPFTAASVNTTGPGSVFGMGGYDIGTSAEAAAIGQLTITGNNSASLTVDSNDNATLVNNSNIANQVVTFTPATGRGTVAIPSGVTNGIGNALVFYLSAPGTGFILDATPSALNRAMSGTLTPQTAISAVAAADFPGIAILHSRGVAASDAQSFIGEFGVTTTTSVYAFLVDQRFPVSGGTISTSADSSIAPVTVGAVSATTGRGTLINGTETLAFYAIGPNQFVMIDISPGTSSSVFFANPD